MAVTPKCLVESALLTGSAATQYTAPALTRTVIKKLTIANSDGAAPFNVTIYLVPSGGTAGADNLLVNAQAVAAGQTMDVTEAQSQILETGDFISAFASTTNKLVIRASGVEMT